VVFSALLVHLLIKCQTIRLYVIIFLYFRCTILSLIPVLAGDTVALLYLSISVQTIYTCDANMLLSSLFYRTVHININLTGDI